MHRATVRAHRKASVQSITEKVKSVDEFCEGQAGQGPLLSRKVNLAKILLRIPGDFICRADGQGPAQRIRGRMVFEMDWLRATAI